MYKKVSISLILVLVLSFSMSFAAPSDWSKDTINQGISAGLIPSPLLNQFQDNITREQFSGMILSLYEKLSGETVVLNIDNPFTDTTNVEILKAYQVGIISGTGGGKFSPSASITREQIAVMFYKCIKLASPSAISNVYPVDFADNESISSWATEAIGFMNYNGLLSGTGDNKVAPKGNASREQAMVLVTNTYQKFEGTNLVKSELKPSEISKRVSPAIVYIETYDAQDELLGTGSGINIAVTGKIFTNFHVIEGASKVTVKFVSGEVYDVSNVLAYDVDRDVAVLKITGVNLPTAIFGNSSLLENGEEILTIGSPIGLENTISDGLVSNRSRQIEGQNYLQISAPISPGSSGGALVNLYGEIVGITSAQFISGQNLNLAIPINEVKKYATSNNSITLKSLKDLTITKRIDFEDGGYYIGEVIGGVPEGKGTIYYVNGDQYTGDFVDGLKEGNGIYTWENGDYYEGEFFIDYMHGDGIYTYADGLIFSGSWFYDEVAENKMIPTPYAKAVSNSNLEIGWEDNQLGWYYHIYYAYAEDGPWYTFEDEYGYPSDLVWLDTYSANLYDITPGTTVYITMTSYIFDIESDYSETIKVKMP